MVLKSPFTISKDIHMEGPSVKIAADAMSCYEQEVIKAVSGNTRIGKERLLGRKILDIFSRGKNLFIGVREFALKTHFGMYGSWRIDEERDEKTPRLSLIFDTGYINLYNCSVKFIPRNILNTEYPERRDILSPIWDLEETFELVSGKPEEMICDILLDQGILPGVGNIIKNEALNNSRVHPESLVAKISEDVIRELIRETRAFSLRWYKAKKEGRSIFGKLNIYRKTECPLGKVTKKKTGKRNRWSYICPEQKKLN
jgi:endonuclease-8